jgi:putative FmdB family regulatory protein
VPIYEYFCRACGNEFELLVRGDQTPECPACNGADLEKLISLPRVHSEGTRAKSMRAAKRRDAAQATDLMHERLQYEESHDRHG